MGKRKGNQRDSAFTTLSTPTFRDLFYDRRHELEAEAMLVRAGLGAEHHHEHTVH